MRVANPIILHQLCHDLFVKVMKKRDLYLGHPETELQLSHHLYRMARISYEFESEFNHSFSDGKIYWRGQFLVKVIHVAPDELYVGGPELEPSNIIQNPEYIAIKWISRNGRIRYEDWEHNPKDWT